MPESAPRHHGRRRPQPRVGLVATALLVALPALGFAAQESTSPADERVAAGRQAHAWKLTTGLYRYAGGVGGDAVDINLRHTSSFGNTWIGYYESTGRDERQWRIGWDRGFETGALRVLPSIQAAERGFVGGTIYVEAGEPWFAGAGLGRTNLKPYVNLNFDPNDAYTLSAGRRTADGETLSATLVRDNREHPDQRHLHFLYRASRPGGERVTIDLLFKKGEVGAAIVERWGLSVGYDWPRMFVRVAWDPKANFGTDDMLRLSIGGRF